MNVKSSLIRHAGAGVAGLSLLASAPLAMAQSCETGSLLGSAVVFHQSTEDLLRSVSQSVSHGRYGRGETRNYCPLVYRMAQELERDAAAFEAHLRRNRPLHSMCGVLEDLRSDFDAITRRAYDQRLGHAVAFQLRRTDGALDNLEDSVFAVLQGPSRGPWSSGPGYSNGRGGIPQAIPLPGSRTSFPGSGHAPYDHGRLVVTGGSHDRRGR